LKIEHLMPDRHQKTLWLIRHARPLNVSGLCYGATDLQVSPQEDERVAKQLALELGEHLALISPPVVWVSQRQRTQSLARAIGQALPVDVRWPEPKVVSEISEFDFGRYENTLWQNIDQSALDAWVADFAHFQFGGIESTAQMLSRVHKALNEAREVPASHVIWITHAGVIKAVQWLMTHDDQAPLRADAWPSTSIDFGSCLKWTLG
jgi:alpha-ribazole phosphatase